VTGTIIVESSDAPAIGAVNLWMSGPSTIGDFVGATDDVEPIGLVVTGGRAGPPIVAIERQHHADVEARDGHLGALRDVLSVELDVDGEARGEVGRKRRVRQPRLGARTALDEERVRADTRIRAFTGLERVVATGDEWNGNKG
jgi:hypothetical protein